jgi:hypothetical protein
VLLGVGGMLASCVTMILAMQFNGPVDLSQLLVLSVLIYVSFFEFGLGAIPWMIGNEIFPSDVKVRLFWSNSIGFPPSPSFQDSVIGVAAGVNWFSNFAVGMTYPLLRHLLGEARLEGWGALSARGEL